MESEPVINLRKIFIKIAAVAGILGCLIDTVATFLFGSRIDGFNQFKTPMSQMGISSSPIASEMSVSWILMGILVIIFAIGMLLAFKENKRSAVIIFLLLILYGFGEGMVSGLFPADKAGDTHTWIGYVHNLIGGVGVIAIMLFPLFMLKLLPDIKLITKIVLVIGTIAVIMFAIGRLIVSSTNFLGEYKGSWQRIYVFTYYIYIIIIAIILIVREVPVKIQEKARVEK